MAKITINNLNKLYAGGHHAVKDLTLESADEEFVVLVGPSGCGKSTTLRMVAGLEEVSSGTIEIGGRVVNALPPRERDVAMVFQNYALYQHMTVYDNLAFGLKNARVPKARIDEEIRRAVAILGIGELLERKPRQLSGGQQQRVALGRCIVRHPKVFLFDEPLSNLDAKLRAQMRAEIKKLRERVPTTSLFVTHDQVEAMTLGDRVVIMRDGVVEQIGTPLEVYNQPASKFVGGFIGAPHMNFIDLRLDGDTGRLMTGSDAISVPRSAEVNGLSAYAGKTVTMGIRPEHISVGPPKRQNYTIQARIAVVEQMGSEIVLEAKIGDNPLTVSRVDPGFKVQAHSEIPLHLDLSRMHFFDPDTGRAIR